MIVCTSSLVPMPRASASSVLFNRKWTFRKPLFLDKDFLCCCAEGENPRRLQTSRQTGNAGFLPGCYQSLNVLPWAVTPCDVSLTTEQLSLYVLFTEECSPPPTPPPQKRCRSHHPISIFRHYWSRLLFETIFKFHLVQNRFLFSCEHLVLLQDFWMH